LGFGIKLLIYQQVMINITECFPQISYNLLGYVGGRC
jgi:hypothetical protein